MNTDTLAATVTDPPSRHPLAALGDPATARKRCAAVLRAADNNDSPYFRVDREPLPALAERVAKLARQRWPDLKLPVHSLWSHLAGPNKAELDAALAGRSNDEVARAQFDLAIVSEMLGAAPGPAWGFTDGQAIDTRAQPAQRQGLDQLMAQLDQAAAGGAAEAAGDPPAAPAVPASAPAAAPADAGLRLGGAQGLALACFRAFMAGVFSADPSDPLRCDAAALQGIDGTALRAVFQTSAQNPLVGLEARAHMLARLGQTLFDKTRRDGGLARPALLYDLIVTAGEGAGEARAADGEVRAAALFALVQAQLAPAWDGARNVQGLPAGDVWAHRWAGATAGELGSGDGTSSGYLPLHRPVVALCLALVEPLQWAGLRVTQLEDLPALADWAHGGLLLDSGIIVPRHASDLGRSWQLRDEFVVEWRALTLTLMDTLAAAVRERLDHDARHLPMACLMSASSAVAHEVALQQRGSVPPLRIESDGTLL